MNNRYLKEKNLTLKQSILLAVFLVPVLALKAQNYNNIEFIENKGQWDSRVKYKGNVNAGAIFLRSAGFTVVQHNQEDINKFIEWGHGHSAAAGAKAMPNNQMVVRSHAWNVDFVGADAGTIAIPEKVIPTYNNYFYGNDPSKWAANCRIFQAITLQNVYPNIDVRYYTDNGTLKYDILVKPGGNPARIALKYEGTDKIQVKNKELVVSTTVGERRESSPFTYQVGIKERKEISCKYVVKDNIVRFDIKDYDPTVTLVIDPTLIFCSFSGSTADNWGYTATYGPDGAMYGGGIVRETNGFPVSPGAYQTVYGGGNNTNADGGPNDIGIIKLTPDGTQRVYATYLGGSGNEQPHSLVVTAAGELVVAGRTNSGISYPVTAGGLIGPGGSYDIVVTKLTASGGGLVGSKRIGGTSDDGANISPGRTNTNSLQRNYGDDGRSEVIVDGAGNIYVASCSQSTNFPVSTGPAIGGKQDAVLLKFNAAVNLTFARFIGGSENDAAYVLAIGPNGNIFVAGGTESPNLLPGTQAGTVGAAFDLGAANGGKIDGFVAEITQTGVAVRSAFIGTAGIDQIYGIQFDRLGFLYVMGTATGDFVIRNATFSNTGGKQFIAKLEPDLSAWIYSTVFGTNEPLPNISPTAFLVDRCENVYVSGWGGPIFPANESVYANSGTSGLPTTPDALDPSTDNSDFYFFVMARDATAQLYGSFFGQTGGEIDHVDGGTSRFDRNGVIYQAICGNCKFAGNVPFPTTPGVWSPTNPSPNCNLAMVKIAFNLAGVGADVESAIGGVPRDTSGCVPLTVQFTDMVRNADSYIWNFGDGSPDVGPLPEATGYTQSWTYNSVGTYRVMLVAINPTSCNVRDTSYINIRVGDIRANLDFTAVKSGPDCTSFQYTFTNTSTVTGPRPYTDTSFIWDFGDGSPKVIAGLNPPQIHTYANAGLYNVILTLRDTAYCNYPDADTFQLSVDVNVDARFTTPPTGCAPYDAEFDNTSIAGQTWLWDFGDGQTSTEFEPTHTYNTPGTYVVTLTATNPNTCNVTDVATFTINVLAMPTAAFSYTPTIPVENTPHFFTNLSSPDAVRFKWEWGDGDSLLTTSRGVVQHQYNATGTFNACLTAYNQAGCPHRVCQDVRTLITPVVDVPNAFTPQSGDINSRVMVRGFGIAKMRFIIWNRWGQKVFETGNRFEGWDGKVKGQIQPMDVYAYTLDIEFFDGTKTTRKGDITLIR